eukprot:348586-Rhodomonas_salina.4
MAVPRIGSGGDGLDSMRRAMGGTGRALTRHASSRREHPPSLHLANPARQYPASHSPARW